MSERIYLDANATTAALPAVIDAVAHAMREAGGNASSLHGSGRTAARALSAARSSVAQWLGARPTEVVFTSGGTESDRLGVLGALVAAGERRHVVASTIEHPAVRSLLLELAQAGSRYPVDVTWIAPGADGKVAAGAICDAVRPDTALATLMWANNETGVLQPVTELATRCKELGVPLLVDAVQAVGKLPIDFRSLGADLLALSAHKFHGPKGVGALLVRDRCRWKPPFPASQEARRRGGTEAVPLAAGLAAAAQAAADGLGDWPRVAALRDRLESALTGALEGVHVNGTAERTPNTLSVRFDGLDGDRLLARLDRAGIDASNGSACTSGTPDPSHVLLAMGLRRRDALASVRFSLSRATTKPEIDRTIVTVLEEVETLRRTAKMRR